MTKMRNVKGYLSDDGVFFDAEADAELYEALQALEFTVRNIGADPNKFMVVVEGCRKQLERYLNAKSKFEESEASGPDGPGGTKPASEHHTDDGSAVADASVQQQPPDSAQHVPDLGGGIGAEAISNDIALNGAGGRSAHARSVRRAALMATASGAAIASARGSGSSAPVRQAEARPKLPRADV
jgi:hypothetical protein